MTMLTTPELKEGDLVMGATGMLAGRNFIIGSTAEPWTNGDPVLYEADHNGDKLISCSLGTWCTDTGTARWLLIKRAAA